MIFQELFIELNEIELIIYMFSFSCFSKKNTKTKILTNQNALEDSPCQSSSQNIKCSLQKTIRNQNTTTQVTHPQDTKKLRQVLQNKFNHIENYQSFADGQENLSCESSQTVPYSMKKSIPQGQTIKFSRSNKNKHQNICNQAQILTQQQKTNKDNNNNNKSMMSQSQSQLFKTNGILDIDQSLFQNQEEIKQKIKQLNQQQFQKMSVELHQIQKFQQASFCSLNFSKPKEMITSFKNNEVQIQEIQVKKNSSIFLNDNKNSNSEISKDYQTLQEEQRMKQSIFTFQPTHFRKSKQSIDQQEKTIIMETVELEIWAPLNVFIQSKSLDSVFQNYRNNYKKPLSQIQVQECELDQTYQQAENSFFCNNINEEFVRAVINKKYSLAFQIFKKMEAKQRQQKDSKGYYSAYISTLAVLSNPTDPEVFEFAKKIIYNQDVNVFEKGPCGWTPLQQAIYHKHIRLTPHLFISSYKSKNKQIKQSFQDMSSFLLQQQNFSLALDVKVDSFIPFVGSLTPNDKIIITKFEKSLLIQFTLVGYEFLTCKRRDMACYFDGQNKIFYGLNRSKGIYADLLQQLDKDQIQAIVVDLLSSQTKKISPIVNKVQIKKSKSIFDNDITQQINEMIATKYNFSVNYTSTTEKRKPSQKNQDSQIKVLKQQLSFFESLENYKKKEYKVKIKDKNRNKKVELDMWLYDRYGLSLKVLIKVFSLFSMSNHLAKIIYQFLQENTTKISELQSNFPVKIDIPINFSLYFNLQFQKVNKSPQKQNLKLLQGLKRVSRKQYQNLLQSRQKRSFIISAFT